MAGETYNTNNIPYVVSADVAGLFTDWASENRLTPPSEAFFEEFSAELRSTLSEATGHPIEVVGEQEIREGLTSAIENSKLTPVSLDRAYIKPNGLVRHFIDATRAVNPQLDDIGMVARPGFPDIQTQIAKIAGSGEQRIVLVDDVIFSGDGLVELASNLQKSNIRVVKVIAGIGIRQGIEKVIGNDIDIECVRTFEEVVDEVCERDFVAGVPLSGRTIIDDNGRHWSAPYFEPFGKPEKWASIAPESVQMFSRFCIEQSIKLWEETNCLSGITTPANQIARRIKELDHEDSVVESLKKQLPLIEGVL